MGIRRRITGRQGKRRTSLVFRAVPILVSGERKVRRADADERIGIVIDIISEAVSQQVPGKGTNAGVEEVLEKDVLDVLGADAPSAKRGEAGLHQEDQRTCGRRERFSQHEIHYTSQLNGVPAHIR